MSTIKKDKPSVFIKTVFRGFLIVVPILGVIYLLNFLYETVKEQVDNIIETTPIETEFQVWVILLVSILVCIIIFYCLGLVSKTKPIAKFSKWIDEQLIENIEIYRNLKLKIDNRLQFLLEDTPTVFVTFGQSERPGFLMKEADEQGKCVVFIPKNINNYDGSIYIVNQQNVRLAQSTKSELILSLDHLGAEMNIK